MTIELDGIEVKIGSRMYSLLHGWGDVVDISMFSQYPIRLLILERSQKLIYTANGKADLSNANRTLFWDVPVITPPKPPVAKKTVEVSDWVVYNKHGATIVKIGKTASWINDYLSTDDYAHVVHDTGRMVEQDD